MEPRVPKHYRVKAAVEALIAGLPPGSAVPTERALAERLGTSRTTLRQALAVLVADGRLERAQGRGTFVAEPKRVLVSQLTSYSDDLRAQGADPTSTVLDVSRRHPDAATAERLGVGVRGWVHRVERVRGVSGAPLAYEVAQLVGPLPRLAAELDRRGSLYLTLREAYGITIVQVRDVVETVAASPAEAALLQVDVGLPLLLVHRTAWDGDGRAVEQTRSAFRGDRFSFVAQSAG